MKVWFPRLAVAGFFLGLCLLAGVQTGGTPAAPGPDLPTASDDAESMPDAPRSPESRPPRGGPSRRTSEKNHASVKAAFGEAAHPASTATVRILAGAEPASLGTVVDADGLILTKASVLEGELLCRLDDGTELAAELVAVDEDYDLALVKIDADGLTPVRWRTGDVPPPGSIVAAVAPDDSLLAVGVVSAAPREVPGSTRPERVRGWLGVVLGGGQSGLGVTGVYRGSPAGKAGLKVGDRIKRIDGKAMKSTSQIVETVGSRNVGQKLALVIQREDEEVELAATLGKQQAGRAPQDHWGGGPFSRRRQGFPTALAHDAVVHPDDCGGPLVDTDGNVVGINVARALRVTTYAIPAETVLDVLEDLRASGPARPKAK